MSKQPKFIPYKIVRNGKNLWRIRISARFTITKKPKDIYYDTRREAEYDRSRLLAKYYNNELSLILAPSQTREAQLAYAILAEHESKITLVDAVNTSVVFSKEELRDTKMAFEMIRESNAKISLCEAIAIALEQRGAQLIGITVSELMKQYKESSSVIREWTQKHLDNYRFYSTKFSAHFGTRNIADLRAPELRVWFADSFASATYFNSALSVIAPAFSWAVKQEILQRSPFDLIERRRIIKSDGVDVFTPDEAITLLSSCRDFSFASPDHPMADENGKVPAIQKLDCRDCILPFSLLLFSGVRPDELKKMTWEMVHLDKGFISIPPSVAKTNQVRNIELKDNLKEYLKSIPEKNGAIVPTNWKRKSAIVRKAAGLQNRSDTARHSFASYSLAVDPSTDRLKENMGHSKGSDMLFKHYRAAVSRQDAELYWEINPACITEKILQEHSQKASQKEA